MGFLATFVNILLTVISFAIIGRAIISWFDPAGRTAIARILTDITEPVVRPIRRLMPQTGMVDFSPLIALLVIYLLQYILSNVLRGL